jgi:hypothetical protein
MGIFQELKRRNVIRVGLAYVLAAWPQPIPLNFPFKDW